MRPAPTSMRITRSMLPTFACMILSFSNGWIVWSKSVGELQELLDLHQPTLSQQLGVLRTEGLVETGDGKRIYYSVADRKVLTLLKTLYDLYCPKDSTS
jgi:DNA-binding transcriptional ArsR family regulator